MSDAETKVSWVYHKGWKEWRPLGGEYGASFFSYQERERNSLPALPDLNISDDRDHDITQVHTDTGIIKYREPVARKFNRYRVRIPADIFVGSNTFQTHTANISEGGFYFEDPLPDWVAGYFTVTLKVENGKVFEFTCFLAEDQKREKFRTEIAPSTSERHFENFKSWLASQSFPVSE